MNDKYDNQLLKEIKFYETHPEYLPFVGDKFDDFKILQVGESHYIGQTPETEEFSIAYFHNNWWQDKCLDVFEHKHPNDVDWGSWYKTRDVIERFFKNYQNNYSIFSNPLKVFLNTCLQENQEIYSGNQFRQAYHYFAFMNFFQMPALYDGEAFWKSLKLSAKKLHNEDLAAEVFETSIKNSACVLDKVIEILQPNIVVFTSSAAWSAYIKYGTYADSQDGPVMIQTAHPGCCWWNRKKKNGISSCMHLETELKKHIKNKHSISVIREE